MNYTYKLYDFYYNCVQKRKKFIEKRKVKAQDKLERKERNEADIKKIMKNPGVDPEEDVQMKRQVHDPSIELLKQHHEMLKQYYSVSQSKSENGHISSIKWGVYEIDGLYYVAEQSKINAYKKLLKKQNNKKSKKSLFHI